MVRLTCPPKREARRWKPDANGLAVMARDYRWSITGGPCWIGIFQIFIG